jgi:hypothetical protein
MTEYIVDTNVPLVAQGTATHMSDNCVFNCANFLLKLFEGEFILVIDNDYHLIGEYQNQMPKGSQAQYGNRFLRWIYTNQANPQKIKTVEINKLDEFNFKEVPRSIIDIGFDNSDRKFVAVAIANENQASIVQAADSKWIGWEEALNKEGVSIHFICREELEILYKNKKEKK